MSFGGSAAGEFCLPRQSLVAALNMDGRQPGTGSGHTARRAVALLRAEGNTPWSDESRPGHSTGDRYRVEVAGATHWNFSDASLVVPILETAGLLGRIDGRRMEALLSAYTLAFFDRYLRDGRWPLLFTPPSSAVFRRSCSVRVLRPIEPPTIRLSPPGPGSYTRRSPRP